MKTYNFTSRNMSMSHILRSLFFIIISTMVCHIGTAQGTGDDNDLKCEGHKNMSLGAEGCATLTSSDLHSKITTPVMAATYPLELQDENEDLIPDNKIDCSYVGQTLKYTIYSPGSTNSCWGTVLVEDKIKPEIECEDITVSCTLPIEDYPVPMVDDNCEVASFVPLDGPFQPTDCDEELVGSFTRRWIATDIYGNQDTCVQEVSLLRTPVDMINWPGNIMFPSHLECGSGFDLDENGNPDPSVTGTPMIGGVSIYPFINGVICNGYVEYEDEVSGNSCSTQIMRTWTVGEWHCSNPEPLTWLQLIEIRDTEGPAILTCPDDITVSTSGKGCTGAARIELPTYSDLCGNSVTVNIQYGGNTVLDAQGPQVLQFDAGTTTVTFEVIDPVSYTHLTLPTTPYV